MTKMTAERAKEVLGLTLGCDTVAVRVRYAELHAEYQVRLTNAPTAALKATYQGQLEELREAVETLAPEFVTQGNADLPAVNPVASAEDAHSGQTVSSGEGQSSPRIRRALQLAVGAATLVVVALGTYAIIQLTSSSQRPAISGTTETSVASPSNSGAGTLLISVNAQSRVQVDGQDIGEATPELPLRYEVEAAKEHLVRVVLRSGSGAWTQTVTVPAGGQKVVAHSQPEPASTPTPPKQVLHEKSQPSNASNQESDLCESGGWMWTPNRPTRGNRGAEWMTLDDASKFAQICRVGGYTDWHLPSVADLVAMSQTSQFDAPRHDWIWTADREGDQLPPGIEPAANVGSGRPLAAVIEGRGKVNVDDKYASNRYATYCVRKSDSQ